MTDAIPLYLMQVGQTGEVCDVVGEAGAVHRLHELGLCPGACVEMVQPGSPCIVRLVGQKLCLRGDETLQVLVSVGSPS